MRINLWSKAVAGGLALLLCGIVAPLPAQEPPTNVKANANKALTQGQENVAASPNGKNWTSYNGDYSGQRYSSLSNINTTNVSHLRAAWIFHAENTSKLEVTPVVYNGVMYVTAANTVSALDARTGRELWKHERAPSAADLSMTPPRTRIAAWDSGKTASTCRPITRTYSASTHARVACFGM